MIRAGETVVQFTWSDEPGQWRDHKPVTTSPPELSLDKAAIGAVGPRPEVKPMFRLGAATKDHPEWA